MPNQLLTDSDCSSNEKNKNSGTASYFITKDDYIETIKLARALTFWRFFLYLIWLIFVSVLAWFLSNKTLLIALIAWVVGAMYLVIAYKVLLPRVAGRDYERHKAMHSPVSIVMMSDGLSIERRGSHTILYWDELHKWQENDQYFLLYTMPRIFHIIPKKISENGFDIEQLRNHLIQEVNSN